MTRVISYRIGVAIFACVGFFLLWSLAYEIAILPRLAAVPIASSNHDGKNYAIPFSNELTNLRIYSLLCFKHSLH